MNGAMTPEQLHAMLDIAYDCAFGTGMDHVKGVLDRLLQLLPVRQAVLCRIERTGASWGVRHLLNHSFDRKWTNLYVEGGYQNVDPVMRYAAASQKSFLWEESLRARLVDPRTAGEFFETAADYRMVNGVAAGVGGASPNEGTTVLSCETGAARIPAHATEILHYLVPHIHEAYTRALVNVPPPGRDPGLSVREIEVLKWAKEGKSAWEISLILRVSERTVKFHFGNIFKKLDVVNRSQAIARALGRGYI